MPRCACTRHFAVASDVMESRKHAIAQRGRSGWVLARGCSCGADLSCYSDDYHGRREGSGDGASSAGCMAGLLWSSERHRGAQKEGLGAVWELVGTK
jgi:hypothetical protein